MSDSTLIGLPLVLALYGLAAFVLLRYPDFRRAFLAYWHPEAVAARMSAWAERARRSS
jgi:hypothetical protein